MKTQHVILIALAATLSLAPAGARAQSGAAVPRWETLVRVPLPPDGTLRFQAANADATSLVDVETRSTWDPFGLCVNGPLKGTQLKSLILIPEFWFAWSQFRPGTRLFTAGR